MERGVRLSDAVEWVSSTCACAVNIHMFSLSPIFEWMAAPPRGGMRACLFLVGEASGAASSAIHNLVLHLATNTHARVGKSTARRKSWWSKW